MYVERNSLLGWDFLERKVFFKRRKEKMETQSHSGFRIYVGNLEYGVTEQDLETFIQEKGFSAKEVRIIKDRISGRSKGFGFAEFETEDELNSAISALDGQDFKGRKVRVDRAREKTSRPSFNRGSSGRFHRGSSRFGR